MKRKFLFSSILVLVAMLFTASQVLAAPPSGKGGGKDNPGKSSQTQGQTQGNGNNGQGQKNNNDHSKNQKKGKPDHFKGVVTAKTDTTVTLTLTDGSTQVVGVDASTQIKIPTMKGATLADLNLNVQVVVQARGMDANNNPLARMILVVPGKPMTVHRVGKVTAYTAANGTTNGSITVQDIKGGTSTFVVTAETKILPSDQAANTSLVGLTVTIISRRDPTGGPLTAQGIVIHVPETDSGDNNNND